MFKTAYDMSMAKISAYQSSKYARLYCKCVMCCCAQFTHFDITIPEPEHHNSNNSPKIHFSVYYIFFTLYYAW